MRYMMVVTAAAFALVAGAAGADVKAGVDAWTRGDYKKAVEEWRALAVAGNADAQYNMGQAYKLGRGVPVDPAMAESWFRKAALQGHAQAEDNYGLALFQADKKTEALPWLEKSVARFEPRAQLVLGTMLFNGDGVPRDWPRAYALMTRASAAGLDSASQTLAQMDQYITLADRQKGTALAQQMAIRASTATPRPAAADGVIARPAPTPVASPPVRTAPAPRPTPTPAPARSPVAAKAPAHAGPSPAKPPRPAVAKAEKPAPGATGGAWKIQLGAFRDRANAEGLWKKVAGKLRGARPAYVAAGAVTRLQATGLASKAEATRACAAATAAGAQCLIVAP